MTVAERAIQASIPLPHGGWLPRDHQDALWNYLAGGGERAVAIWHRRAGKDEVAMHFAAVAAHLRVGNYWHCLPEYAQARKAIWDAVNPHSGKRRIDEVFPVALRENTNDGEMKIRFRNGSTWQCIGSDVYDRTVGSSAAGCTYSEYALSNPSVWAFHRPMLSENRGWAIFISTPRGFNHCKAMYDHARHTRGWFAELLTARDTGALSEDELAETLAEYQDLYGDDMGRASFQQEYECSWNAAILGSFYASEMASVREQERITEACVADGEGLVHRAWDLGVHDDTVIWWFQAHCSGQLLVLGHYAASGVGLEHYLGVIEQMEAEHGWRRGSDYVPHDAKVREFGSGRTRVETMASLGLHPLLVPDHRFDDGINAVRRTLPLCVFHPRCGDGINALEQYRREWDDEKKAFRKSALHDWTSHPADAFRYLAMGWKPQPKRVVRDAMPRSLIIPPPGEPRRGGMVL